MARVYADLEELIGRDRRPGRPKVKWVDALRTLGLTAGASDDGLEMQFNVRTDPAGLTDADLPIRVTSRPRDRRPVRSASASSTSSQLIEFAEAAGQSIDPSFGDYEQAKQTLDSRSASASSTT